VLTCIAVVAAVGVLGMVGCGESTPASGTAEGEAVSAQGYPQWMRTVTGNGERHLQVPLIALNCPVGNGFRCDRIVFSYALRLPARRFRAWVAGRPVRGLRTAAWGEEGPMKGETGLGWTGFVQPAGLTESGARLHLKPARPNYWAGTPPVTAPVRIAATLKSGERVAELFPFVRLQAGYG
jgi:hypothetical protein